MMKNIKIPTHDGFILDADFYVGSADRGILFLHGACAHRGHERFFERAAVELAGRGANCLLIDFRAHGKSSGDSVTDFLISGLLHDVSAAVQFLQAHGVNKLALAGASVGASVAALYAGNHAAEIEALALVNPVLNFHTALFEPTAERSRALFSLAHATLKEVDQFAVPWNNFRLGRAVFNELRAKETEFDPIAALTNYQGPLLVMHGDCDDSISYDDTVRYYNQIKNSKKTFLTIKGANHSFETEPQQTEVVEHLINYFSQQH